MSEITSDTARPYIIADGNFDIINLYPGATYAIKVNGTFQSTVLAIHVKNGAGDFELVDDADATGIDGTGVTEFQIVTIGTAIRIVASATATAPAIDFTCAKVLN